MTISSEQIDIHISIHGGKATVTDSCTEPCEKCKVLQTENLRLESMVRSLREHLKNTWEALSDHRPRLDTDICRIEALGVQITRILSQTKI